MINYVIKNNTNTLSMLFISSFTYLFVRVDVNLALDAALRLVRPAVGRFPFPLALGALELPEAALDTLIRSLSFLVRPRLNDKETHRIAAIRTPAFHI